MTGLPDPRPRICDADGRPRLEGWRCAQCRTPLALDGPWCPRCRGALQPELFDLSGTVWSATVLRVALPGREPPTALAYIDLDNGPRVLGHIDSGATQRLIAGTRVTGIGLAHTGDVIFKEQQ